MRIQERGIWGTFCVIRIRFFTGNSIPGTGCEHSFAADNAEPSHHFAQESPQPWNLINLVANAYNGFSRPPSGEFHHLPEPQISVQEMGAIPRDARHAALLKADEIARVRHYRICYAGLSDGAFSGRQALDSSAPSH